MSKHTPGPWRIEIDDSPEPDWSRRWPTIVSDEYEVVGTEGIYGDFKTDMANARLIAAAPDLLEALQYLANVCPAIDAQGEEAHQRARAAIAKATGCEG